MYIKLFYVPPGIIVQLSALANINNWHMFNISNDKQFNLVISAKVNVVNTGGD